MEDRIYHIKISPEFIKNDIFQVGWTGGTITSTVNVEECCEILPLNVSATTTGLTYAYSSMTEILSGGTNGTSLLTGLTVPIFLTENTVDVGYYSVFDGMVIQQDTMTNFLFSASSNPYVWYFYNTSDIEFKKYLSFSNYKVDWGDGTTVQTINDTIPVQHTYPPTTTPKTYTITVSGLSPWGSNVVKKDIVVPYSAITATNPKGTAYFYPSGGNWSGTPLSYDYLFSGDAICNDEVYNFSSSPVLITGYTTSSLKDIEQYGVPKYKLGIQVTGTSGVIGTYKGSDSSNTYTAYTINGMDYFDFKDGTTLFAVYSSGMTSDMVECSAITKNEVLLNVIDEPEIYSNVFIERGKNSALERIQRLGEVDNVGDLVKYGYKFFNINKI